MLTVILILAVIALILVIVSAIGKCPLWIPVILLCIIELIRNLPIGK